MQDAILTIKKAKSQIAVIFGRAYVYYGVGRRHFITTVQIYNEDVKKNLKQGALRRYYTGFAPQACIDPVLGNEGIMPLINALSEARYSTTLVFVGLAIWQFDVATLINLINKIVHPITLVFANINLGDNSVTSIARIIREARNPITLIFENSKIDDADVIMLAEAIKKTRAPIILDLLKSDIEIGEPFIKAMQEARAPAYIKFFTSNTITRRLYIDTMLDNFVVDAIRSPLKFFQHIGVGMVSHMIDRVLSFSPKELVGMVKSYIGDAELAWTEVLAIRNVDGASYQNKYSSINTTALMSKYFPNPLVEDKRQAMKGKDAASSDANNEAMLRELLLNFLTLLGSNSKINSTVGLADEFGGCKDLIKFLTLMPSVPLMTIPAGFINVPGDGLCFYHAVAQQLGYMDGIELQRRAVNEILTHYPMYKNFLENSFWDDNLESPGKDGRGWAGHVMIRAVASMLHRPIEIRRFGLDGIENQDKVLILPYELNPSLSELRLGNIANLHFVASDSSLTEHAYTAYNTLDTDGAVARSQESLEISGANTKAYED